MHRVLVDAVFRFDYGFVDCGVRLSLGKGRTAPEDRPQILVHKSVEFRMQDENLKGGPYKPRLINWDRLEPDYVK